MQQYKSLFYYLLLLTGFFLFLEISFFVQCNAQYFGDIYSESGHFSIPFAVIPGVVYFLFAQLLLHVGYTVIAWLVAVGNIRYYKLSSGDALYTGIVCWVLGLITILTANAYYFPNSKFSNLIAYIFVNRQLNKVILLVLMTLFLLAVLSSLRGWRQLKSIKSIIFIFLLTASVAFFKNYNATTLPTVDASTKNRPNIILVGIDSLRPDFLGFFGSDDKTTFLDSFLSQSTVFSEAVTPLARTYPSWSVILTGLYPRESGVRFNLPKKTNGTFSQSLPAILKTKGYRTLYATDETRFSNIDQQFEFDEMLTPPIGLHDFLLGTLNDFPFSNLLIGTVAGKILFPYSYANRPVYFTYNPNTFLELLKPALAQSRSQPVFLAVHFCLPHHPYLWAGIPANNMTPQERYQASIKRVDRQVRDFFALLKQYQLLEHAIVVVLSDHGEALELNGDRVTEEALFLSHTPKQVPAFYPPSLDDEKVNQSAGHGTDVLGLTQYHSLLAFKLYGLGKQAISVRSGRVSLLDIKPTLLSLIKSPQASSGMSLASQITSSRTSLLPQRHLFMESDFSPAAIRTVYPDTHQVLLEGLGMFQVDPDSLRLQVKDEMGNKIIKSKQYADLYGEWLLALYPQEEGIRIPILVNLRTGQWTNDMRSSFAQSSPSHAMLSALKAFYGEELS